MAHKLRKVVREIAVQIKMYIFSRRDRRSVIVFLQKIRSACDACRIHEGAAMWLLNQILASSAEAAVQALVTVVSTANFFERAH